MLSCHFRILSNIDEVEELAPAGRREVYRRQPYRPTADDDHVHRRDGDGGLNDDGHPVWQIFTPRRYCLD